MDTMTPQKSVGTRRKQQKAQTRALILDSARGLFENRGFEGTTMRAVAAEAEVGLGTIFSHFPDKGALLIAALLEDLAQTDQQIFETLPAEAPIRDQIMHISRAGFGYWCRRPSLSATLLREIWFVKGPWAEKRREETTRFIEFCARVLEAARQRGELRPGFDLQASADALYSYYVGILMRAASEDQFDAEVLLEKMAAFVDNLLEGIGVNQS